MNYYFRAASSPASDDTQELSAGLAYRLTDSEKLRSQVIKDPRDSGPGWGIDLTVTCHR